MLRFENMLKLTPITQLLMSKVQNHGAKNFDDNLELKDLGVLGMNATSQRIMIQSGILHRSLHMGCGSITDNRSK